MTKFQVNKTYTARSIGDANCVFEFTIIARTAKRVTINLRGERVKRGIFIYDGVECFRPFGNYSMAVVVSSRSIKAIDAACGFEARLAP